MVGNPFSFQVNWASALVEYQGNRVTVADAVANGWLYDYIFRWDNAAGKYTWQPMSTAVFVPWEGEWVKVKVRGAGWPAPDLFVIIPPAPFTP
jgi:hypothetical protein